MALEMRVNPTDHEFDMREISCPICRTSKQKWIGYRGGSFQRYGLGVATRIVQCRRCWLLFPNPFPYPRNPERIYQDPVHFFERHNEEGKVFRCRKLIREVIHQTGKSGPSILDVGSGRGEFLQAAHLEGLGDVVGLEFSQAMIAHAQERYGMAVIPQTIEQYAASQGRTFDAVVLNAVLEHVYDPDSMIEACARLTRRGGLLYIDTPNEPNLLTVIGNFFNRLGGGRAVFNLSPTWPPYHVFGFNPYALRLLLEKHNFVISRIFIHHAPAIPSRPIWRDRFKAFVAMQIGRLANVTGTASNLYVWARRA